MDEHLQLAQTWLQRANEATYTEAVTDRLRYSLAALLRHLESLQPQPETASVLPHRHWYNPTLQFPQWTGEAEVEEPETPQSGPTSLASVGANQGTSATQPTPETGITADTSSHSARGPSLAEMSILSQVPLPQPSRTTAPTSYTPSTERSTGPSAPDDEFPISVLVNLAKEFRSLLDMPIMRVHCPSWSGYSDIVDDALAMVFGTKAEEEDPPFGDAPASSSSPTGSDAGGSE